jgi:hypothetical protein
VLNRGVEQPLAGRRRHGCRLGRHSTGARVTRLSRLSASRSM